MPRHRNLNLQKFLASVSGPLLWEYFQQRMEKKPAGSLRTFNVEAVNQLLDSIEDEDLKGSILEDFTHINDVSEKQMNYLIRSLDVYNLIIPTDRERQDLAMDLFLHHRQAFDYAYDYFCLYNASSKMSQYPIPCDEFQLTPEKISIFQEMVRTFYAQQAKGKQCLVRHYDEEDKTVIVVIHGSYRRSVMTWDEKQEITRTYFFRPANEDILQYQKDISLLSIKASLKQDREFYIRIFKEAILNEKIQESQLDLNATYTLEPLQKGNFSFAGNEQITRITLKEIKLALGGLSNPTVTISSTNILNSLDHDLEGLSLSSGALVHAKFCFELKVDKNKTKKVAFEITPPNVTDLTRKRYADIIGDYLKENGIKLI